MFKMSSNHFQKDLFSSFPSLSNDESLNECNNDKGWCNQFCEQIVSRIDQSIFKILYDEKLDAHNSLLSLRVGMITLKEKITPDIGQLLYDPVSTYRHKADQKVKDNSMNLTETILDGFLDLIVNVQVDKTNVTVTTFVEPIGVTETITDQFSNR